MTTFHLDFILNATKGKLLSRHCEVFDGVGTDTRANLDGQLFIALKGDAFDAHIFVRKAVEKGAQALLVHSWKPENNDLLDRITVIQVPDTLLGLQSLAREYRRTFGGKVIGIAGSNGKTTSKEFTAALISAFRKVHYSKGSFNNHWGVPFTLLATPEEAEVAVVEMGMNHAGELALLTKIAQPDVNVVTYVGIEHIEFFGTLEKIAQAEKEIYDEAPVDAIRIYNLDNPFTRKMYAEAKNKFPKAKLLTFSTETPDRKLIDVSLKIKSLTMQSLTVQGLIGGVLGEATVPVFGLHNVTNLMVAASAGLAVGLEPEQIWQGLSRCETTWGRNQLVHTKSGAQILFDGYNSNPDSMRALVENMRILEMKGKKVGIFGEMKELGDQAPQMHRDVGVNVGRAGFDVIWFYGPHFEEFKAGVQSVNLKGNQFYTPDYDENLAKQIAGHLSQNDIALVKGSRGMKLERFVHVCEPLDFLNK